MSFRQALLGAAFAALACNACGTAAESSLFPDAGTRPVTVTGTDASVDFSSDSPTPSLSDDYDASLAEATATGTLTVTPSMPTVTVTVGAPVPTVAFQAYSNGQPVAAQWNADRGEVGVIDANGVFTPTGTTAGTVNIAVSYGGRNTTAQVTVNIVEQQNGGSPDELAIEAGAGGFGGVGGPGIGPAITDPATLVALTPSAPDASAGGDASAGSDASADGEAGADASEEVAGGEAGADVDAGAATDAGGDAAAPDTGLGGDAAAAGADAGAAGIVWLYPYDGTVWPRGLLAPLLQWRWAAGGAVPPIDGIAIHLQTQSGSFVYDGMFGPPAALAGQPFLEHPIPQDAWTAATNSATGTDPLLVSLTVASAGVAYGPINETWTVAPARLTGTVYYNSYMTNLVTNSNFTTKNAAGVAVQWGAAVLGIQVGETDPFVVAGTSDLPTQPPGTGCRVCHSVAANGAHLIVQQGTNYALTSDYNLLNNDLETPLTAYQGIFGWAALSPDSQVAVTNTADLAASDSTTHVYAFPPGVGATPLAGTGLDGVLAATPAFSPDGKHIAFTFHGGTLAGGFVGANGTPDSQVVVMDFDGQTFTNARAVFTIPTTPMGQACVGFPSFTPDSQAVLIQLQLAACGKVTFGLYMGTGGVNSELWWAPIGQPPEGGAIAPIRLNALNGKRIDQSVYLPTNVTHLDDSTLNYEPTVNPVVSGGYAWVVFTSRRLYGNVATIAPMLSDPRDPGFSPKTQVTPKKLWVAAINLNAPPGTDPSYPPFYLPAQELYAGNSRGFWVLNPCEADGQSCTSGDQCCGGFCEPASDGGGLVCGKKTLVTQCAQAQERCAVSADCCDAKNMCINGFCAIPPTR